jgi:hypothetical protein
MFSVAGLSVLPASVVKAEEIMMPSKVVEFITHFPLAMTLSEYRGQKTGFENKDKVTTLVSVFKKSGKMMNEEFSFHGTHSVWRVEFKKEEHFTEWMNLTEEVESHQDSPRQAAGFRLEIRHLS